MKKVLEQGNLDGALTAGMQQTIIALLIGYQFAPSSANKLFAMTFVIPCLFRIIGEIYERGVKINRSIRKPHSRIVSLI